ncbi:MAG TPA: hypothetical protein V6D28_19045 [Leptolyngbyaceae cyanobacterium]
MEPTEAQYIIINALETLELLQLQTFDLDTGNWYIGTPSPILPLAMVLPSGEISGVNLPIDRTREITVQSLVINALETLELIDLRIFDSETGNYYIRTPSPVLPVAMILESGEIVPTDWML